MPRARPPRPYDPEIGELIVARIAAGEELRDLWRDPTLPGRYTLKRWRHEVPAFSRAVRAAVNAARSRVRLARSPYGGEVRDEICERIAAGASLKSILCEPGQPGQWTVQHWLNTEPDFRRDMAASREIAMWVQLDAGPGGIDGRIHGQKHTFAQLDWEAQQAKAAETPLPRAAANGGG